jgi:hypothetical protein
MVGDEMSADIIKLKTITKLDLAPTLVLEGAVAANLTEAIVIGREPDGELYLASSLTDAGHIIVLLETFKKRLLEAFDE